MDVNMTKGKLSNTKDYPIEISYNGNQVVVAPRQVIPNVIKELLGPLDKGLVFIKN